MLHDLFHVVAKYGWEIIDRVRVDEVNRLRGDWVARKVVKSSRWLRAAQSGERHPRGRSDPA